MLAADPNCDRWCGHRRPHAAVIVVGTFYYVHATPGWALALVVALALALAQGGISAAESTMEPLVLEPAVAAIGPEGLRIDTRFIGEVWNRRALTPPRRLQPGRSYRTRIVCLIDEAEEDACLHLLVRPVMDDNSTSAAPM